MQLPTHPFSFTIYFHYFCKTKLISGRMTESKEEMLDNTMTSKPRYLSMDKDDLIWEALEEGADDWVASARTKEIYRAVGDLILKYKEGQAEVMHPAIKGGYNVVYRLEYKDGSSVIMRVPIHGKQSDPRLEISYLPEDRHGCVSRGENTI